MATKNKALTLTMAATIASVSLFSQSVAMAQTEHPSEHSLDKAERNVAEFEECQSANHSRERQKQFL
ncbi:hypothetical protein ACGE24_07635 [Corynebacterium kroppenstedtii]|uniref:hypothetical protein n=1 Tax=Corynebacterium sp. PCR 32 TaxID=3351342 RepID=UPI0030961668